MKWKVCGMREPENISQALQLNPDFMGFIFYDKSSRFAGRQIQAIRNISFGSTAKVGVFVNSTVSFMLETRRQLGLDYIQLHGDESLEVIRTLNENGISLIRAVRIKKEIPLERLAEEEKYVDYFLFDTDSKSYGGSGLSFNWNVLKQYDLKTPFLLSGGINLENIEVVKDLSHSKLAGVDVNSRFEMEPGVKEINLLKELKKKI